MQQAFGQAWAVKGKTLPNPPVGAVLVKGRRIIGVGGTSPVGGPHAEIMAMRAIVKPADLRGATLYVTLEPCCHHGRTPPCTDAIIAAGIKRVVVSAGDPNPKVAGKGIAQLRQAGIEVIESVLGDQGQAFYRHFAHHILSGRPRIIVKIAQSREGAINAGPGKPARLTGRLAQIENHRLRAEADAWLIGAETLRRDDPQLTPRLVKGPPPEALVLSRGGPKSLLLKVPGLKGSGPSGMPRLLLSASKRKVRLIATKRPPSLPTGVHFTALPGGLAGEKSLKEDKTSTPSSPAATRRLVRFLLEDFKARGYHLVVIEGGRGVWGPFLQEKAFDELWLFTSPQSFPDGERWNEGLPRNWDKSLVFRSFTPLGKDELTVYSRG
jgi:diaminohydroxyphosphoribosylaminopyrimidine deaminase / 5-amino-6-(5-phosphoribosylamino)uracil reductase